MSNNGAGPVGRPNLAAPPGGVLHENLVRTEEIVGPSNRRFGLTIGATCGVIGGVRALFGHGHSEWWLGAGLVVALFAVFWPAALAPFNQLWLEVGLLLYKIVNPVVMTVLFVSTIVPVGALLRLRGKDPLRLKPRPDAASYWIERQPPRPGPEAMKNQF
jgi:Saxitoxin biosynthesis operon protein SxtJ